MRQKVAMAHSAIIIPPDRLGYRGILALEIKLNDAQCNQSDPCWRGSVRESAGNSFWEYRG